MSRESELQQFSSEIDELLRRVEGAANPSLREDIIALIGSLMGLHQKALAAMLEIIDEQEERERLIGAMIADPMIEGVLLLHDLHPDGTEVRVQRAVERAAKRLRVSATLSELRDGTAHVQVSGEISGCGSAVSDIAKIFETAICNAAPEIVAVELEGELLRPQQNTPLVQLEIKSVSAVRP